MTENVDVFDLELDEQDMRELAGLDGRGEPSSIPTGSATEVGSPASPSRPLPIPRLAPDPWSGLAGHARLLRLGRTPA
jgi:hypothetical protein